MMRILLIALGGAIGATLRYALSSATQRLAAGSFPIGTLAVNVLGCLIAGVVVAMFAGPHAIRAEYRMGILIGLLGGFTTFSTFGLDTVAMTDGGHWRMAALNVVLSNTLAIAAAWAGYRIGIRCFGA